MLLLPSGEIKKKFFLLPGRCDRVPDPLLRAHLQREDARVPQRQRERQQPQQHLPILDRGGQRLHRLRLRNSGSGGGESDAKQAAIAAKVARHINSNQVAFVGGSKVGEIHQL